MRARRGSSFAALGLLSSLASGCISQPARTPRTFGLGDAGNDAPAAAPGGIVVAVERVSIAPELEGLSFVYRVGTLEFERDPWARFAAPPARLVEARIRADLGRRPGVGAVLGPGGDEAPVAVLRVDIEDLSGEFSGTSGAAGATARLRLRVRASGPEAGGDRVFLAKVYERRVPLPARTPDALAAAWGRALGEIDREIATDLAASVPGARP